MDERTKAEKANKVLGSIVGGYEARKEVALLSVITIPENREKEHTEENDNLDGLIAFGGNPYAIVDGMIRQADEDPIFERFLHAIIRGIHYSLEADELLDILDSEL